MGVALSPWPNSGTQARTSALEYIKSQCAGRAAESDEAAAQLGELGAALVEAEAPLAPQAAKNEAVVRIAGYLSEAAFGAVRGETIGPLTQEYVTNHAGVMRRSGAQGLLRPWKIRRAGSIG